MIMCVFIELHDPLLVSMYPGKHYISVQVIHVCLNVSYSIYEWYQCCSCSRIFSQIRSTAFQPSHPSWRPIFCLSRSHTTTPLFSRDVSLVPCPISYNPLPLFQEPRFSYCPPHLFYTANREQHPLLSPFIFGQPFSFYSLTCSSGLLHFHVYIHSLATFNHYPFHFALNTFLNTTILCFPWIK